MATGTVRITIQTPTYSATRGPMANLVSSPSYTEQTGPVEVHVPDLGQIPLNAVITRIEHASYGFIETPPSLLTIPETCMGEAHPPTLNGVAYRFTGGSPFWTAFPSLFVGGMIDPGEINTPGLSVGIAYEINKSLTKPPPFDIYPAGTSIPRADFFAATFGHVIAWANGKVIGFPDAPGPDNRPKTLTMQYVWVEVDWESVGAPIYRPIPQPQPIPTPIIPTPCCTTSVYCQCSGGSQGPTGPPGSNGSGSNGAPGSGSMGPGGPAGRNASGPPAPNAIGPIGGGGGGGSGWNPGGVGWNQSYCTETAGSTKTYTSVDPSETFTGTTEQQQWLDVQVSTDTGFKQFLFGLHHPIPDPPTYQSGYKSGKLLTLGTITRGLSTRDGDAVGSSIDVQVDDADRETRIALDDNTTPYFDGSEAAFKIVTETRRVARGTPTALFRGYVKGYGLGKRRKARFQLEDAITSEYGPLSGRRLISDRKLTSGLFPFIPPQIAGTYQPIIVGLVGDWGATLPGTATPSEKGIIPVYTVGNRTIGGQDYTEFFVCGHAVESLDIYGADAANLVREKVDDTEYGSTILAPHKPGWPFANQYIDYTDSVSGLTHRCTTFFILTSDVKVQSHLNSQISIAVNVCGMEDIGDGTGEVITGLFYQWQHLIDQYILTSPGYYSGAWVNVGSWSGSVRKTRSASFTAAQTRTADWIGGEGYQGASVISGGMLAREVMRRYAVTSHCDWGWTKAGQIFVSLPDDTMSLTGLTELKAPVQLREGISPTFGGGAIENPIFFNYDMDWDKNRWRSEQLEVRDSNIMNKTGFIERPVVVDLWMTRDPATAQSAMNKRLLWHKAPLPTVDLHMPVGGLDRELGDVVLVTHEDGIGATGYDQTPVRLVNHQYNPKTRQNVWTGVVMDETVTGSLTLMQTTGTPAVELMQTSGSPVAAVYMRS